MNLDHFDASVMTISLIMRHLIINDQEPIAKIHVSQLSQIPQFLVSQKFILRYRVQNFGSTRESLIECVASLRSTVFYGTVPGSAENFVDSFKSMKYRISLRLKIRSIAYAA